MSAALIVALGCSSTYDTDGLRADGGDADADADTSVDAANTQPDAASSGPDARDDEPDSGAECDEAGEPCCSEGIDSCNGDFLECVDGICTECGIDGMACCETSPFCQGDPLLLECPLGLLCIL